LIVFYSLPMRYLIHSTAKTNPPAFLTLESTCYKRYMAGLMNKMSGVSSGSMA
jgi:hypothetical protein